MDLLPIRPVEFERARNTAQIGSESIEMIPNLTREAYNEFTPIFTSISCPVKSDRPVEFDRARNTAQIGSKSIEMIPNSTREAYNEFTPIFTNISCPVKFQISPVEFDRA